ncbi:hypothetical protein TWF694_011116 [Orbilia ellipsospora]|uniref:ABC transporter n=1 Tax=Orbilia ellipsospora TaxID=2528407 RepID=A0AAV9XB45_9PEZI
MSSFDHFSSSIPSKSLPVALSPSHSIFHEFLSFSKDFVLYYFPIIWIPVLGATIFLYKQKLSVSIGVLERPKNGRQGFKELFPILRKKRDPKQDVETIATSYRLLYYQLQHLENHPDAIPQAWNRLQDLFDLTLYQALRAVHPTILSINEYSLKELKVFLSNQETHTSQLWTEYLDRRTKGGRELLLTKSYAEHWLRLAAPVKYVDGAWLGRIHHADTPLNLRPITRIVWQIFSEELGDGDLAKNHVHVYSKLLESIGLDIGAGDSSRFIDKSENPGSDPHVWAAAVAQLALGSFPDELLPEILGFNLAFEAVTLDTLMCIHELKELSLDPTYFSLHVTIDNADSGHTAMALEAVAALMRVYEGSAQQGTIWRRVQAGYILAEGLPITPRPLTKTELAVLDIFSNKCRPAKVAHQGCRARISGRALRDWMDVTAWEKDKFSFLEALGASSWVSSGRPNASRLIKEIAWEGKMFGAFTQKETKLLKKWISDMKYLDPRNHERSIQQAKGAYTECTGEVLCRKVLRYPTFYSLLEHKGTVLPEIPGELVLCDAGELVVSWRLLLAVNIPLQHYISTPIKAATVRGMTVLRILRLLNGLGDVGDVVSGMDEVLQPSRKGTVEIVQKLCKTQAGCAELVLGNEWDWLRALSIAPEANFWFLVGVQYAMVLLMNNAKDTTDDDVGATVRNIGSRVKGELDLLDFRERTESKQGFWTLMNVVNHSYIFT